MFSWRLIELPARKIPVDTQILLSSEDIHELSRRGFTRQVCDYLENPLKFHQLETV